MVTSSVALPLGLSGVKVMPRMRMPCTRAAKKIVVTSRSRAVTVGDSRLPRFMLCWTFAMMVSSIARLSAPLGEHVHELPRDVEAVEGIEFAHAGGARHVDLREPFADHIQAHE